MEVTSPNDPADGSHGPGRDRRCCRRLLAAGEQVRVPGARSAPARARTACGCRSRSGTSRTRSPCARRCAGRGRSSTWRPAIRDQPAGSIEELNGLATARLLRYAEAAGAERFLFFGAIGATPSSRTRFFRAKALAERAVMDSALDATVLSPSIVYAPGDPWLTLLRRMSLLPVMPISGSGRRALPADLGRGRRGLRPPGPARGVARAARGGSSWRDRRCSPTRRSCELALSAWDRTRPLRARAALDGAARPARCWSAVRAVGVRHLGGGRADGGADDDRCAAPATHDASASSRSPWRRCWGSRAAI